jgi:hypothetical protein
MEQVTTVGIDLAKNAFPLHGVDATDGASAHGAPRAASRDGGLLIAVSDRHGGLLGGRTNGAAGSGSTGTRWG